MKNFNNSFIWGIGDADLQVIGEDHTLKYEESQPTMWTDCAKKSAVVWNNETPLSGVDRYHRYKEDINLLKNLGIKHYRTSVSMSRLLTKKGEVNRKALEWYQNFFKTLRDNDIKIYVTLYHWELPLWIHQIGGWTNKESIKAMTLHSQAVAQELDDFIEEYFIFNEPSSFVFAGYDSGIHAPFEKNLRKALLAAHNMLLAQGESFRAIKSIRPQAKIGTVYYPMPTYSTSSNPKDLEAQKLAKQYFVDWFLDPLYLGEYPRELSKLWSDLMPKHSSKDLASMQIGPEMHALGLNYYFGQVVRYPENKEADRPWETHFPAYHIKNDLGWPIFTEPHLPNGYFDLMLSTYSKYRSHGLNLIYATENGTACSTEINNQSYDDSFRIKYLEEHLKQLNSAIRAGVPIKGYFLWTLLDNYEWQEAYRSESAFGLVHVDRKTLERTPKKSYYWYQKIIQENGQLSTI